MLRAWCALRRALILPLADPVFDHFPAGLPTLKPQGLHSIRIYPEPVSVPADHYSTDLLEFPNRSCTQCRQAVHEFKPALCTVHLADDSLKSTLVTLLRTLTSAVKMSGVFEGIRFGNRRAGVLSAE